MNQQIQEAVNRYNQPKLESDIDLIGLVRNMLISVGLGQRLDAYDNDRFILEANNKSSDIQRFLLNRYWNQQLISCERQSMDERFCLIPNGTIIQWLDLFEKKVLPFVVENNLPVKF